MFLLVVPRRNGSNGVSVDTAMMAGLDKVPQDGGGKKRDGTVVAGEVIAQGQRRHWQDQLSVCGLEVDRLRLQNAAKPHPLLHASSLARVWWRG